MNVDTYVWVHEQLEAARENGCIEELRTETDDWVADNIMFETGGDGHHEDDITEAVVWIRGDRFRRAFFEIGAIGRELPDPFRPTEEPK